MKLWRIYQDVNNDYDTYDSAVVAAPDMDAARAMHPGGELAWKGRYPSWAYDPSQVGVQLIGDAAPGIEGVICASFNAG